MPHTKHSTSIVQLNWSDKDGSVTVTPEDQDRFNMKIGRVIQVCQEAVEKEKYIEQFNFLLRRLASWLSKQKGIEKAFVTIRDGRLLFLVVRNEVKHNPKFEDSLSDLDIDLANDTDLNLIHLDTLALPATSDSTLSSFLDKTVALNFLVANEADHIALANRNHDALEYLILDAKQFPEWISTIAFYKAVQLIEAAFSRTPEGCTSTHGERLARLKINKKFSNIYKHFRPLWAASTIARYLSDQDGKNYKSFSDYITPSLVLSQFVNHRLKQIENSLFDREGFLGAASKKTAKRLPVKRKSPPTQKKDGGSSTASTTT